VAGLKKRIIDDQSASLSTRANYEEGDPIRHQKGSSAAAGKLWSGGRRSVRVRKEEKERVPYKTGWSGDRGHLLLEGASPAKGIQGTLARSPTWHGKRSATEKRDWEGLGRREGKSSGA